jgi:hypothetical protein
VVQACDGKTVRGSRTRDGTAAALFGVFEHRHRLVSTRRAIDTGNEIAALAATLDILPDLHEVLVTADALHTQREHATYLHGRGAHYLFTVKRNQPTLHAALAGLPWAAVDRRLRRQSGHGRTASRPIAVLAADGAGGIDDLFPACRPGDARDPLSHPITCLDHRQADPRVARRLAGPLGDREPRPSRPRRHPR